MPSVDGNGADYAALDGSSGGGAKSLPRKMSASGVGSFSGAPGGSGPSSGSASPMNATASATTATLSTMDAWLVQKLKNEWSSYDLGPLLTRERLSEAVTSFPHLDTPIKVRLLLSFLSMKREEFDESKFAVVEILDAAEKDSEEWVRVGAGIVNQYLFMSRNGGEDSGTFLHDQLATASSKVLAAVADKQLQAQRKNSGDALIIEDFFCHENAYLSASVRPELAVQPAAHFTLSETAKNGGRDDSPAGKSSSLGGSAGAGNKVKPPPHRPQMARAHSQSMGLSATPSLASSSSSAARAAPPAIAVAKALPPKKSMSELSSEIRRKADAGRFKRQRNRISVIDIDEVKQIESEKALKAEEQKKRLKAAKDDRKSGGAAGVGGVGLLAGAAVGDKNDGGHGGDDAGDHEDGSGDHAHESQYDDPDDRESDREDDHDHHASSGGASGYANDGTQALLHAAFHSTGDVMKEVVSQPYQTQQHNQYHQQQQQQPLYASRGFEPEDAHASGGGYGGNAYGYGSGYGSHSFGDHQGPPPYNEANGQYANGGFGDDQQQQQQQQQSGRYESSSRERGGFLDGPPEYWR